MHLPASHLRLQRPTLFVNHTLRPFEEPGEHTKKIQLDNPITSNKVYSLSPVIALREIDSIAGSYSSTNTDSTSPCSSLQASVGNMSRSSGSSHELDQVPVTHRPVLLKDKYHSSSYNLEMYAPTAQFPGLQSCRLPVTNPSFELARFLKSTGPGPSKQRSDGIEKNKKAQTKYKSMFDSVKKATMRLQAEEESTPAFRQPLVGVVQKKSRSGKYLEQTFSQCTNGGEGNRYLQIITDVSDIDDCISDRGDNRDTDCPAILPKSAYAGSLEKWIADLKIAAQVRYRNQDPPSSDDYTLTKGKLRTSQSFDIQHSKVQSDAKVDNEGKVARDALIPSAHSMMKEIRPRSSSLRANPKAIVLPPSALSESTLSCTESEERLMDSPSTEDLPRTDFITMTYDESQDIPEKSEKTCAHAMQVFGSKKDHDHCRKRKDECEDISNDISLCLSDNQSGGKFTGVLERNGGISLFNDSTAVSRSSSYTTVSFKHKERDEWVRKRKLQDLHKSRSRKYLVDDDQQEHNSNNNMVEETCFKDRNNEIKAYDDTQTIQNYENSEKAAISPSKSAKSLDKRSASLPKGQSPAVRIAKEMGIIPNDFSYELIHPAHRPKIMSGRLQKPADIPAFEPTQQSGKVNSETAMQGETLPNSMYHLQSRARCASPLASAALALVGGNNNKPLPPIRNINATALSSLDEEMTKRMLVMAANERKHVPNTSHVHISVGAATPISSPLAEAASSSLSVIPSPSSAFKTSPAPAPAPLSASPTRRPPPSPQVPLLETTSRENHLEHRIKQLERENALLQTALAAVVDAAGTRNECACELEKRS